MGIFSALFGKKTNYKELIGKGAVVLDVRTKAEYDSGHIKDSKHIPIDQVQSKLNDIKKWGKPVITCCRSGARSGMAKSILSRAGVEAYNGGPWNVLNTKI